MFFLLWRFSHCSNKLKFSVNFSRAFFKKKRKEKKLQNSPYFEWKKSHLSSYLDNEFLLIARTRQESIYIYIYNFFKFFFCVTSSQIWLILLVDDFQFSSHSEPAPSSGPWRMNGKWSENNFLLGFSFLANHGG